MTVNAETLLSEILAVLVAKGILVNQEAERPDKLALVIEPRNDDELARRRLVARDMTTASMSYGKVLADTSDKLQCMKKSSPSS